MPEDREEPASQTLGGPAPATAQAEAGPQSGKTGRSLNVSLASIEAFVIAANHTSLSEAARASGIPEDTFRKRLDALEIWANVSLMQRRPDLLLTPDGVRLLPLARQAVRGMREFIEQESFMQAINRVTGKIRKSESGGLKRKSNASETWIEID